MPRRTAPRLILTLALLSAAPLAAFGQRGNDSMVFGPELPPAMRRPVVRQPVVRQPIVRQPLVVVTPVPKPKTISPALSIGEVKGGIYLHDTREDETSWYRISTRYGVDYDHLLRINKIGNPRRQLPGKQVLIDTVRIIPKARDGVVVNQAEMKLYVYRNGEPILRFGCAVGRADWRTPLGTFGVADKVANPTWYVPPSIQEEMRRAGREPIKSVPPGPGNPLGSFWIGVGDGSFGIHGTNNPGSIGYYATHGCIRLHTDNARQVFKAVTYQDTIRIVYQPVKMGVRKKEVYLQVLPRVYGFREANWDTVKAMVAASGIDSMIDWKAVEVALKAREGVPVYVSKGKKPVEYSAPLPSEPTAPPVYERPVVRATPRPKPTPKVKPTAAPTLEPSMEPTTIPPESPEADPTMPPPVESTPVAPPAETVTPVPATAPPATPPPASATAPPALDTPAPVHSAPPLATPPPVTTPPPAETEAPVTP